MGEQTHSQSRCSCLQPGSDPVFCHWPAPPCLPAASLSSCTCACHQSDPCHQLSHCSVHDKGEMVQLQESMLTVRAPRAASEPIVGCSPCHYVHVCSQPLPLHRHLQLATAAECACNIGSSYHCFLPWSLAALPEGATEDPSSPCSRCYPPSPSQY